MQKKEKAKVLKHSRLHLSEAIKGPFMEFGLWSSFIHTACECTNWQKKKKITIQVIRILARKHEVLKIIPWLEPCVEFGVVGAAIACMHVCMCILWWVVGKGRRQQKVVWIKPEWKNSLSFLWALIITPREPLLHCVYLLSQLAVYTLSFSHIHMYTNSVVSPYTHTHRRLPADLQIWT